MKKFKRLLSCIVAVAMIAGMLVSLPSVFADEPTTLTVDPSQAETGNNFKTIRAAVAKAKEINPQSEDARVTINVQPGKYEEQVEISGVSYVTLQQTPSTDGYVELSWYYCTGYAAANCDLSGKYNPNIDWYKNPPKDESNKVYKLGEVVPAGTKLTYTTVDGKSVTETVSRALELGSTGGMDKMAALLIQKDASNITVKDLHIINSVPVMVTKGQKDAHLTPVSSFPNLPARDVDALAVSADGETTTEAVPSAFNGKDVTKALFDQEVAKGTKFTSGESTWLARSGVFNERGHAVACCGDKITFDSIYLRGGQDSLYIAGENRMYFKDSTIIGATDYIYGSATAVFNNCKLGLEGFSDKSYGSPIATAQTPTTTPYGYLFYNCTLYNVRDNNGENNFGGSWNSNGQATYYNCKLDDNGTVGKSKFKIADKGWGRFDAELGLHRLYEYGTTNNSGTKVDLSKRVVNKSVEEGGPGMGTVLDEWQILEFNPRNYFAAKNGGWKDDWDPMGVSSKYTNVDAAIEGVEFNIPSNESTEIALPTPPSNVEYKWKSASPNAVVEGNKVIVTRPAAGEPNIKSEITLYVRDKSDTTIGDKTTVPIEITPTTNKTDVFNISVKVTSELTPREDSDFTITILKNGAPIKTQVVTMKSGTNEVSATIENVPASAEGIDYDVKIVSKSNDLTVVSPDNGETKITGKTNQNVTLNISAQMLVDDTVELSSINYNCTQGNKSFDLIALAKDAGADESIADSEFITVEYTLNVEKVETNGSGFIDLVYGTPNTQECSTGKLANRFVLAKLSHYNQLDAMDSECTGFSGSSDTDNMKLNMSGKFDTSKPNKITTTIDYKNSTVTMSGVGAASKTSTFAAFPQKATKGDLKMAIYAGTDKFNIKDVKVTYKKLIQGELPETPDGEGEYTFTDVVGGNLCTDSESYKFVDGVDENVAALFASSADKTVMDSKFTANYKNYVGGTGDKGTHPTITLNADKGKYRIYYVGYNHGKNVQAKVNGKTYTAGTGKQLAARSTDANYVLNYYEIDIEMTSKNSTITFDSTEQWLPDTYCVAVVGSAELGGSATPSPSPTASTTPTASPSASTTPTASPSASTTPTASPSASTTPTPTPSATLTPSGDTISVDFTKLQSVPVYSKETGNGFVSTSGAIRATGSERKVAATSEIKIDANGASVTESKGDYLYNKSNSDDGDDYNYGGLIYRQDVAPGAYHLEVEVADASNTTVAPNGMQASRITGTSNWDNCLHVQRTVSAKWNGNVWTYDFATGEDFVEIEIEPNKLPTKDAAQTVGVKSIKITPLAVNPAGDKPTIHILGDSTQKAYSFNETISSWGQMLGEYFDPAKVTVINYSMGGRAMKSNYNEGRTMEPLIRGKAGDYVFIHSAHNDETLSNNRFSRGSGIKNGSLTTNNASYQRWLDMYIKMIKARGMIPVLVTAMPRTGGGQYKEVEGTTPNGFNPDSPGLMREKAKSDDGVGLVELYAGAKTYIDSLEDNEVLYIYHTYEAGETPANNNANGSEGMKHDGTHYREAAAKQFCRIMLQSIYDQSVATTDTYTDKAMMTDLVNYMKAPVKEAAASANHDWSKVFPEMASDVSAVGVVPGATKQTNQNNYYYRNNIEKALQIGALHKDAENKFKPTQTITVGEFARGVEKVFGLSENSLSDYSKTYAELTASGAKQIGTADSYKIDSAKFDESGKLTVKYTASGDTGSAKLIAVTYKDNSCRAITNVKMFDISTSDEKTLDYDKPESGVTKVFIWQDTDNIVPLSDAASIDGGTAPTPTPDAGTGDLTVTVTQPAEGGTVTAYNETQRMVKTVDVPSGLKAEQVISDNEYFKFIAPPNLINKSDSNGKFSNKEISTNYVEFRKSGSDQPPLKTVTYEAKKTGTLVIYASAAKNKAIVLENTKDGKQQTKHTSSQTNAYASITYDVQEGETYLLYTSGGTGKLFGISYEGEYPQSTTSLKVNSGDTIRVTASANDGYTLNSVMVNGEAKATTREYTFTITANTTVSAKFDKEPELVEHTMIASDAALTREAMGAILYDAYTKANAANGKWITNAKIYMSQKGGALSPDDPNYDPNITYNGGTYLPLTGWGALTDTDNINTALYAKVKQAYNLGLMRTEEGIVRGDMKNGTKIQPKTEVTRAKAAKALVFCYILGQLPTDENHLIYMENQADKTVADIAAPNSAAQTTVFGE